MSTLVDIGYSLMSLQEKCRWAVYVFHRVAEANTPRVGLGGWGCWMSRLTTEKWHRQRKPQLAHSGTKSALNVQCNTIFSSQARVYTYTYTRAHAKTLLFCSNDLQCVSFVTQRRSAVPSLIKGLFGKEQAAKNADSFSLLHVCTAPQWFENVVESIMGAGIRSCFNSWFFCQSIIFMLP